MAVIMREAIKPNLLQTLENTPVLVHAGPFGNIATATRRSLADLIGIRAGDYLITEAGLRRRHGRRAVLQHQVPDLGPRARRRRAGRHRARAEGALGQVPHRRRPAAAAESCSPSGPDDVEAGAANLRKQIENVQLHGVTPVVAINAFPTDHRSEHEAIRRVAEDMGARVAVCTHFADGGAGADRPRPGGRRGLRRAERRSTSSTPTRRRCVEKIETVATKVYGAGVVEYMPSAGAPARHVRAQRVRPAARLHRQDAPVDLRRPGAEGRADGPRRQRARGAGVGRRRVRVPDLRRDAHDAGPRARTRPPPSSTSTSPARSSGCRNAAPFSYWDLSPSQVGAGPPRRRSMPTVHTPAAGRSRRRGTGRRRRARSSCPRGGGRRAPWRTSGIIRGSMSRPVMVMKVSAYSPRTLRNRSEKAANAGSCAAWRQRSRKASGCRRAIPA